MKSKTAERILSETPQETKDKVKIITDRQIQLLKLGFEKNEHQRSFQLYKYDVGWAVDFHEITDLEDSEWNTFIDDLIYDLETAKKQFYMDLKESDAYLFAQKEFKKQILDSLNKYRADLQQVNRFKLDKIGNQEARIRLESKVEVLIELQNKLKTAKP